ncbi:asparagine synthase-related protein [Marivita sp. S6314]|uniref:asparagine synthase-related protein n=1 Tax=Marivita sp. S6314 TaxID=2926406 RepID=UPI001FF37128|nr:asparagine synthase-related protein [Marivita sp. S6314]MCK0148946.1 asparagine synthase-related protein [Marivita sp. S6314]
MIKAVELAEQSKLELSTVFAYQYVISRKPRDLPGLDMMQLGRRRFIYAGPKLHRAELRDRNGEMFGFVLGIAVDPEGLIKGVRTLPTIDVNDPQVFDRFHDYINDVCGRYVFVVTAGIEERVYTDPVAMIGCVVNCDAELVGSSLNLVLDREVELNPLFDHDAVTNRGGKYTLFHTRDRHVRRLNGSFYLDLVNYTDYRFWPRIDHLEQPVDAYGDIYDDIIRHARHAIGEITAHFSTAMPLSGGSDSRLIAGLAGEHIKKVDQCFTHITNYSTRYDNAVAKVIARHLGVDHETHAWRSPPPPPRSKFEKRQQTRIFQTAVGAPLAFPDELAKNVQQLIGDDKVVLRGHLTDLLRAVYVLTSKRTRWKVLDWQMQRLFPVPVDEFNDEVFRTLRPDFMAWRRTLPPVAMESPLDFMFLEVYYNSTVGALFNGFHRHFYMSPFNSRRIIELSLALNVDYRRTIAPVNDLLYRMDPDLCAIPYYKEAGPDLSVLEPGGDWSAFTQDRMETVRQRFENGYRPDAVPIAAQ